jgi:hypothetical protein
MELGKLLIVLGMALGGDSGDAVGADASSTGAAAGGLSGSRKEYDGVFSAGDVSGSECGVVDSAVCGEPVAAVRVRKGWACETVLVG